MERTIIKSTSPGISLAASIAWQAALYSNVSEDSPEPSMRRSTAPRKGSDKYGIISFVHKFTLLVSEIFSGPQKALAKLFCSAVVLTPDSFLGNNRSCG